MQQFELSTLNTKSDKARTAEYSKFSLVCVWFFFFLGGLEGSEDFACATLLTTPLIFKAKFKIFVTLLT